MSDREKTRLVHASRAKMTGEVGTVNPAVVRASTVLYRDIATRKAVQARRAKGERAFSYGANGTPTTFALEDAINEIEGGERTVLLPTGLAAIAHTFLSTLRPGDHVLLADTVYGPARAIAVNYLAKRGIACEFYPGGHEEVEKRLKPETRMVYLDNPGSIVYDIQDVPALARLLAGRETLLAVDNTWGCPGLYRPLALGADISIVAVTKYVAGHSDLVMGSVSAGKRCADQIWAMPAAGPDRQPGRCLQRAQRLAHGGRPPRHASGPRGGGHRLAPTAAAGAAHPLSGLARRSGPRLVEAGLQGANGLLSMEFKPQIAQADADRFVDSLRLFGIGASWGGYESLALTYPSIHGWSGGALVRLHIGLEDPADLVADLARGFSALA